MNHKAKKCFNKFCQGYPVSKRLLMRYWAWRSAKIGLSHDIKLSPPYCFDVAKAWNENRPNPEANSEKMYGQGEG